jgi:hypothetical protein
MAVTSRQSLIDYVLRELGDPLIEINVTDEQIEDRVDEAILYFQEYYFDGIERMYLKHQITATDVTNKYITLPDHVWGVNRVFPYPTSSTSTSLNIFDLQYQLRMNDLRDLTSTSLIYYQQVMNHIELIDFLLNTQKQFRFNKFNSKLYIDQNWSAAGGLFEGNWLLLDVFSPLDPAQNPKFWNERLFKNYVTALVKKQWGSNLSKYQGIALPGGVTIDGTKIYNEGKSEQEAIEQTIMNELQPLGFMVG